MTSRFLKIILTMTLAWPPGARAEDKAPPQPPVLTHIDQFVTSLKDTGNVYLLTEPEVTNLLSTGTIDQIMRAQADKVNLVANGPDDSLKYFPWSEQKAEVQRRATAIAKEIFALSYEEINLTLLTILQRYLINDDDSRGALSYIIDAVMDYRFSPDEIYRLKKENSKFHQFTQGGWIAILLVAVGMWASRKQLPHIWDSIVEFFSRAWKPTVSKVKGVVVTSAEKQIQTWDDVIADIERSGLAAGGAKTVTKMSAGRAVSLVGKMRFYSQLTNLLTERGLKGIVYMTGKNMVEVTGIVAVGGSADIGLRYLANLAFPESFTNTEIDFKELRDDYFDGLAALHLTCQSHDLVNQVQAVNSGDLLPWVLKMNRMETEFELLKRMNSSFVEVQQLPPEVTFDSQTGRVSFTHVALGKTITETFACSKLKDMPQGPISVSLNEVSDDVILIAKHLAEIQPKVAPVPPAEAK